MPLIESCSSIHSISSSLSVFLGFGLVQGRSFGLVCKLGGIRFGVLSMPISKFSTRSCINCNNYYYYIG